MNHFSQIAHLANFFVFVLLDLISSWNEFTKSAGCTIGSDSLFGLLEALNIVKNHMQFTVDQINVMWISVHIYKDLSLPLTFASSSSWGSFLKLVRLLLAESIYNILIVVFSSSSSSSSLFILNSGKSQNKTGESRIFIFITSHIM